MEFLSGLFQMLGPIGVLVGGFAAASLSVSLSYTFQVRLRKASDVVKVERMSSSRAPALSLIQLHLDAQYTPSKHEALSWLLPIYVAPMIGAYFLTTAYIFRTVVAANRDFAGRLFDWETGGPARGPK